MPIGLALGVLLTLAATRIFAPSTATNTQPESEIVAESAVPAQAVTIAEVTTTDIDSTLDLSGTVAAFERTPVMSQASRLADYRCIGRTRRLCRTGTGFSQIKQ